MVTHLSPTTRTEVVAVHDTTPTHEITHRRFGTRAAVRIADSVQTALGGDNARARLGAEDHVAIAFKKTPPISGPNLSRVRHVNYGELDIRPIDPLDHEPYVPMDHHGDPIDIEAD